MTSDNPACPECKGRLRRKYPRRQVWECTSGHGAWRFKYKRKRRTKEELLQRHECVRCGKKRLEKFMQLELHYHTRMWVCVHCSRQFKVLKRGKAKH